MMNELPHDFPHIAPKDYHYEVLPFKNNVVSVWTVCQRGFTYNGYNPSRCIWGFYHTRKGDYYSPINAKRMGTVVDIKDTSPYTAMKLNLTPLEMAFRS